MALNNYQYGTSPRKIEPEYPRRKRTKEQIKRDLKKKRELNKKRAKEQEKKRKQRLRQEKRVHNRNIAIVFIIFAVLLIISYRNSLINERFNEIQDKKNELSAIEKSNGQLEVNIEGTLNLGNIGNEAKEELGMGKLNNDQKVYVTLDKKDYVESSIEEDKGNNENLIQKIINKIFKK